MNNPKLAKWKLGLTVLGVVTIVLFLYVLVQGISSKQDRNTLKQAQSIADKLNAYVDSKQTIPISLSEAGVSDVPDTITYTRKSSTEYTFCVTFKASNVDVSSRVTTDLSNATSGSSYSSQYDTPQNTEAADLYIVSEHKAGKQCQTIKPYIYSSTNYNWNGFSSDPTLSQ